MFVDATRCEFCSGGGGGGGSSGGGPQFVRALAARIVRGGGGGDGDSGGGSAAAAAERRAANYIRVARVVAAVTGDSATRRGAGARVHALEQRRRSRCCQSLTRHRVRARARVLVCVRLEPRFLRARAFC